MSEENLEKKEPLSVLRMIVAGIGILIMALSGGCTLLLGVPALLTGDATFQILLLVIMVGGIPFAIGLAIFRMATQPPGGGEKREL